MQLISESGEVQEIDREDVVGYEWVQRFDEDLSPWLSPGQTTLRIGLRAASEGLYGEPASRLRRMHQKMMLVWGLSLELEGEPLEDYDIRYRCPDGCVGPGEEGYQGWYAGPATEDIAQSTDGVWLRMFTETRLVEEEFYLHMLEAAAESLGDRSLQVVTVGHRPHSTDLEVDPELRAFEVDLMSQLSDGVWVYAYPLGLYGLEEQEGVFAEPQEDFSNDWDRAARWPAAESCLEGWSQEWTLEPEEGAGSTACLTVKRQWQAGVDPSEAAFGTLVYQGDPESPLFSTDEAHEDWSDGHLVWTRSLSYDPSQPLVLRYENRASCGNMQSITRLRVVHREGDCEEGLYPSGEHFSSWSYRSGFDTPEHLNAYCTLGSAIQALAGQEPWSLGGGDECDP